MTNLRIWTTLLPLLTATVVSAVEPERIALPDRKPLMLKPLGALNPKGSGIENSGIVRSRRHDDLYWIINDSGNEPRVYPVRRTAADYHPAPANRPPGVLLAGAKNVDWEDIAVDAEGHLIVADVGNNANQRRDLVLYYLSEPEASTEQADVVKRVSVRYPEQTEYPAPKRDFNYDCEAVFTIGSAVHLLTKHRSDTLTRLYRLDNPQAEEINELTLLDRFNPGAMVTAADATDDGRRMVFITYIGIWLFERDDATTPFFQGRVWWAPFVSAQMEAVCFADQETLILGDEKRAQLYEVPVSDLTRIR